MAGEAGEAVFRARSDFKEVFDDIAKLRGEASKLKDDVGGFAAGMQSSLNTLGGGLQKAGRGISKAGMALTAGLTAPMAGFVATVGGLAAKGGIERLMGLESATRLFEQMGLSTSQVDTLMDGLLDKLEGTPFALDKGAQAMAALVSAGADLDQVPQLIQQITDAAAFGGGELQDIALLWQQVLLSGRVTNDVLGRMAGRNIPVYQMLAEALGVTVDEVRDLASQGEISAEVFFAAWEEGAKGFGEEGIVIAGTAKSMGETTQGAFANMRTAISRFGATLLKDIFPIAKRVFGAIGDGFDLLGKRLSPLIDQFVKSDAFDTFVQNIDRIPEFMSRALDVILEVGAGFRDVLLPVIRGAIEAWQNLNPQIKEMIPRLAGMGAALGPILLIGGKVVSVIGGLISGFGSLLTPLVKLQGAWGTLVGFISRSGGILPAIAAGFSRLWAVLMANPLAAVIGLLAALVAASPELQAALGEVVGILIPAFASLAESLLPAFQALIAAVLPVLQAMGTALAGLVTAALPFIEFLAEVIEQGAPFIAILSGITAGLWALSGVVGTVLKVGSGIISFVGSLGKAFGVLATVIRTGVIGAFNLILAHPIIAAIAAIIGIVVLLIANWEKVGPFFRALWDGIVQVFQTAWEWIKNLVTTVVNGIISFLTTVWQSYVAIWTAIWDAIVNVVTTVWNTIVNFITTVVTFIRDLIVGYLQYQLAVWTTIWNAIKKVAQVVWDAIRTVVTTVINAIQAIITAVLNTIRAVWTAIWNAIRAVAQAVWNAIKAVVTAAINGVRTVITSVLNAIRAVWTSIWNGIRTVVQTVWNGIKAFITGAVNTVKEIISGIIGVVTNVGAAFKGLYNTIKGWVGKAVDFLKGAADKAKNFLNKLNPFARGSPSLVDNVKKGVQVIIEQYDRIRLDGVVQQMQKVREEAGKPITLGQIASRSLRTRIQELGGGRIELGIDPEEERLVEIARYLEFMVNEDNDPLNDFLADLPDDVRSSMLAVGERLAPLLEDLTPEQREDLSRYLASIIKNGDELNDFLTHLPEDMRDAFLEVGEMLARVIDPSKPIRDGVDDAVGSATSSSGAGGGGGGAGGGGRGGGGGGGGGGGLSFDGFERTIDRGLRENATQVSGTVELTSEEQERQLRANAAATARLQGLADLHDRNRRLDEIKNREVLAQGLGPLKRAPEKQDIIELQRVIDNGLAKLPAEMAAARVGQGVGNAFNRPGPSGDTYIVNNPRQEETEESLRKIATKRSYMGANGTPKPPKRRGPGGGGTKLI